MAFNSSYKSLKINKKNHAIYIVSILMVIALVYLIGYKYQSDDLFFSASDIDHESYLELFGDDFKNQKENTVEMDNIEGFEIEDAEYIEKNHKKTALIQVEEGYDDCIQLYEFGINAMKIKETKINNVVVNSKSDAHKQCSSKENTIIWSF
jgi:hypothetical protein